MVGSICGGLSEGLFKMRGFEDGYMDLAAEPDRPHRIMEKILEIKLAYWEKVLPLLGDDVDIVGEADDLGGQERTLFSPAAYRRLVKPLQKELFSFLHARTKAKVFFHTCGAVRDLIPDLIEVGVDVLNPVQVSATGMETGALKREFGRDLVFWGGGVDTQRVLGSGTPAEVRDEVRRRVADLRDGGGFVFATVHNVQPNVPAENLVAMWEAFREVHMAEQVAEQVVTGRLVLADGVVPGRLVIRDGVIVVDDGRAWAGGPLIAPGFVDVHVHGWGGHDAMGSLADLDGMARALLRHGVTAFLPTAVTAPCPAWRRSPRGCGSGCRPRPVMGRRRSGSTSRGRSSRRREEGGAEPGAHHRAGLRHPEDLEPLIEGCRIITIAPEVPGALALIEWLARAAWRRRSGIRWRRWSRAARAIGGAAGRRRTCSTR